MRLIALADAADKNEDWERIVVHIFPLAAKETHDDADQDTITKVDQCAEDGC